MTYYLYHKFPTLFITTTINDNSDDVNYISSGFYKCQFINITNLYNYIKNKLYNYKEYHIKNICNDDINIICKLIDKNQLINIIDVNNILLNDNFINTFNNSSIIKLRIHIDIIDENTINIIKKLFYTLHGDILLDEFQLTNIQYSFNMKYFKILCKELIEKTYIANFIFKSYKYEYDNTYKIHFRVPTQNISNNKYIEDKIYLNKLTNISLEERDVYINTKTKSTNKK